MTDTPEDTTVDTTALTTVETELPDLDHVQSTIDSAHDAEDHLADVMPDAIQPDDDGYAGMSGPTEGDVEETSEDASETDRS
ncbi:MAG: hypothetical protein ABJA89_08930 [Lapillicoccus sp.]